jgi:hypothetical protein
VPYATFGDPQTLNLYTYVENSPLNRIDADGHQDSGYGSSRETCNPSDCTAAHGGEGTAGDPHTAANASGQAQNTAPQTLDPSKLGPEWVSDPSHKAPNGERWVRGDGTKLDFHRGQKGAKGNRGKDHWHVIRPGERKPDRSLGDRGHIAPGTTVDLPIFAPKFSPVAPIPNGLLPTCTYCEGEPIRGPTIYPGVTPDAPMPGGVPASEPTVIPELAPA